MLCCRIYNAHPHLSKRTDVPFLGSLVGSYLL